MIGSASKRFLLVICAFSILFAGCWDRRELEERISVVAIGIDRVKGKKTLYKISVQIPIPIKIAGSGGQGGGSSESAVKVVSVTGLTVTDAVNKLQERLNQRIFLGHTRILAISEEVARGGLEGILDAFRRDPTIRRLLWPVVVKGEAESLLIANPKLVQIPVVYIMDLIESGAKTGIIPDQTLGDYFIQDSNVAMQPYLNYVTATKDEVAWKGIAVFRKNKMVGVLDEIQSWVLLQLRLEERGGDVVIPMPKPHKGFVTFRTHFVRTRLKIEQKGGVRGGHVAHYFCKLQGDIIETTSPPQFKENILIPEMQKIVEKEMEKRAAKLVRQAQEAFRSDILQLGLTLKAHHYRDYWEKHNFERDFPELQIKVTYDVRIRRLGMEMK